jgi:hypothetical protein
MGSISSFLREWVFWGVGGRVGFRTLMDAKHYSVLLCFFPSSLEKREDGFPRVILYVCVYICLR